MASGTRQDTRGQEEALNKLDTRVKSLESKKMPSQMKLRAGSVYNQAEINQIIEKINELLRELGK